MGSGVRNRTVQLLCGVLAAWVMVSPGVRAESVPGAPPEEIVESWWQPGPRPRGMITLASVYAAGNEVPGTQGLRIGYGYFGADRDDYPWGELWLTHREGGDDEIIAAGLAAVPIAFLHRRTGLGVLVDLGVLRRRTHGDSEWRAMMGAGLETVLRTSRRWDLVVTAEAVVDTSAEVEVQGSFGIRFHSEDIPSIRFD